MKSILFVVGIVIVFGSAGACDLDTITIAQSAIQGVVGLAMMAVGVM